MRRIALLVVLLAGTASAQPKPAPKTGILAAVDDVTRQVAALRGLSMARPFQSGLLGREAIAARLKERIRREYSAEEIKVEERVLKRLGLLPAEADYLKVVTDLLMEQVAGFYDPHTRQLYVADWMPEEQQRPALAHEIDHALQDQHFDLKSFIGPLKEEGDRQLARAALVEGDGTSLMLDFALQAMGIDPATLGDAIDQVAARVSAASFTQMPSFARAPRFIRETLVFPYFAGLRFVLQLRKGQGWKRVDEAFRAPPDSSEQILHPEKFLARERPAQITTAPLSSLAPLKEVRRDVWGELVWRLLLAGHVAEDEAARAAEGWGGDRMVAYGREAGPLALVSLSSWDTDEDAGEAERALRAAMASMLHRSKKKEIPDVLTASGEDWTVQRRGRSLLALFGVPSAARAAVEAEAWQGWKVEPSTPAGRASKPPVVTPAKKGKKGKRPK